MRKIKYLWLASGVMLLIAAIVVGVFSLRAPRERETEVTHVTYDLKGDFTQQAYGVITSTEKQANPVHFNNIIDLVTGTYAYEFRSVELSSRVKEKIQISAFVTHPGLWEKEVVLLPTQEVSSPATVQFPLDIASFLKLAEEIDTELGFSSSSPTVILKATVFTETGVGKFNDVFTQTCTMIITPIMLEWQRPFNLSRRGAWDGFVYEHTGLFGYSIALKPNLLFTQTTIDSEPLQPVILTKLRQAIYYRSSEIKTLEVTFDYKLSADQELSQVTHDVVANASLITGAEGEAQVFSLIPQQQVAGDVNLLLPLDIDLYYSIIESIENVAREDIANTYDLVVNTEVQTNATSGNDKINETVSATLTLKLEPDRVVWPDDTAITRRGTIMAKEVEPNPDRSMLTMIALALGLMALAIGLWTGWLFWESRSRKIALNPRWEADQEIISKHKATFVNVVAMPPTPDPARITILDSLDELVKLADSLLKPVLHTIEKADTHLYSVIDGLTKYEYRVNEKLK